MAHPLRRQPAIGIRGAPSGRRVDLNAAPVGPTPHNLYVFVPGAGTAVTEAERKSRRLTVEVLTFIHDKLVTFRQMGLDVKVNRVRPADLRNPRLIDAMKRRGVARLPALTTPNQTYLGPREICTVYDRNIREFQAYGRRGERAPVTDTNVADDDGDLARHFADEMTFERAEVDDQDTAVGDAGNMMESYRAMVARRDQSQAARRPPRPGASQRVAAGPAAPGARSLPPAARSAPPAYTPGRSDPMAGAADPYGPRADPYGPRADSNGPRRDNVATLEPEDREIEDTIARLARDIDENVRTRAFDSGGGDSLDDDGSADPQDDLMERAFWGGRVDVGTD